MAVLPPPLLVKLVKGVVTPTAPVSVVAPEPLRVSALAPSTVPLRVKSVPVKVASAPKVMAASP